MPFLKSILFNWGSVQDKDKSNFPFNIQSLNGLDSISLKNNITFFIGENGSGKSTLLEAIGLKCGFRLMGGGRGNILDGYEDPVSLDSIIRLAWMPKVNNGFFLRAETFYDFACYIDDLAMDSYNSPIDVYRPYGGKSLHHQSHGEAFISLFLNRFGSKEIYLLDEPEAALSPQRQLAFLRIMWQLEQEGAAQFIIATHSPILMAYPNATIFNFDETPLKQIAYEDTEHYQLTKRFLNAKDKFLNRLFKD
ncbi:MAG: AAA family ATPase [Dehalobacterium sp.]